MSLKQNKYVSNRPYETIRKRIFLDWRIKNGLDSNSEVGSNIQRRTINSERHATVLETNIIQILEQLQSISFLINDNAIALHHNGRIVILFESQSNILFLILSKTILALALKLRIRACKLKKILRILKA